MQLCPPRTLADTTSGRDLLIRTTLQPSTASIQILSRVKRALLDAAFMKTAG